MCGIAGIVRFDGGPVDQAALRRMGDCLAHRGPDGEGVFAAGGVGLAHRRLAIIDPRGGVQPFFNDDQTVVLSYNGEVYNYREIRRELASEFRFRTESDTEVVLRAYERWGIQCLQRFRGMFAFALYDSRAGRLYLVRDRVGIKPLYYHAAADRLMFCSELTPLLAAGVPREIDPAAVAGYFRYQYVPTDASIYRTIRKLTPGRFLDVDVRNGRIEEHSYWQLKIDVRPRDEADALEELNAELDEAARIYVRSDVPFGAFLSGGVDSSLVTAIMRPHLAEPVRTFSIGFQERRHSELPYAAEVSRTLHTNHYEKVVSPDLASDILNRIAVHFGEPFADSSAVPTYYVAREAASQVKMVLSGDGGDELFGGYWSYQRTLRDCLRPMSALTRTGLAWLGRWSPSRRLRKWARLQALPPWEKHRAQRELFGDAELAKLLAPEVPAGPPPPPPGGSGDLVTQFQALDVRTYMLDDILTKVDRMSMANSLEVRVPLLDHKIVELAFTLPLAMKLRADGRGRIRSKWLLKRSAARFFPESFLDRPKQGFGIPIVEWCRGRLRPMIESGLRDSRNPIFQWVRFDYVQKTLNGFFRGDGGSVARVWSIWMFDLWMKNVHLAR